MDDDELLKYQLQTFIYNKPYFVTVIRENLQFPNCQCQGWKQNKMPCKQMMAMFEKR